LRWRATVDESGHYSFAVALKKCGRTRGRNQEREEAADFAAINPFRLSQK
jgi:hypothetical protein